MEFLVLYSICGLHASAGRVGASSANYPADALQHVPGTLRELASRDLQHRVAQALQKCGTRGVPSFPAGVQFEDQGVLGADIIHEVRSDLASPAEVTRAQCPRSQQRFERLARSVKPVGPSTAAGSRRKEIIEIGFVHGAQRKCARACDSAGYSGRMPRNRHLGSKDHSLHGELRGVKELSTRRCCESRCKQRGSCAHRTASTIGSRLAFTRARR